MKSMLMNQKFQLDRGQDAAPIHRQLVDGLSAEFAHLPPGSPIPGTQTLQKRFGVAYMTVTRALDELVLRNEIVRFRGKGSFTAAGRVRTIYFLLPCPPEVKPMQSPFLDGVWDQAQRSGIRVRSFPVANHDSIGDIDWHLMQTLPEYASVIISSMSIYHWVLDFLIERHCRIVIVNNQTEWCQCDAGQVARCHQVFVDRRALMKTAVRLLAEAGRKRILLIHEGPSLSNPLRVSYRESLREFGLVYDPELELYSPDHYAITRGRLEMMLNMYAGIDAVLCVYASQALAAWNLLKSLGRKVPEDLSLVSLEDHVSLAANEVGIAAVQIDLCKAGQAAVQILAENHEKPVSRSIGITVDPRGSIGMQRG